MRTLHFHIILTLSFFTTLHSVAQEHTDPKKIIEAIVESQLENLDEETDVGLVVEDLENLAENPININATSKTELSRLYILNEIQINKLLDYVKEFGPVYSIYELNSIDGFTPDLLNKISLFIQFGPPENETEKFSKSLKNGRHQLLLRALETTQKAKGYLQRDDGTKPYEGNPFRLYTRYQFEAREKFSAGITAEKDPGESFFSGSNKKGFDFYSGHISLKINKYLQNITVGDFIVRSGQGLILWQGYTSGKSVYTMDISKTAQGIRPYTSVDENLFFRGVATTVKFQNFDLSLFYSGKNADANIESDEAGIYFTSLQSSGYHRTISEVDDEKSVLHQNMGAIANYSFKNLKIGATFLYDHFEIPFIPSDQLYNRFRFSGEVNYTSGVNYLYNRSKYQLFGEAAISKSGGKALLQGAVARLDDRLSFSALFRHFDKDYHALWANTFAEGSNTINESGLYFGTKILPVKFVTLSAYSDFYRSEWLNFTTAAPSTGHDILGQINFVFSRRLEFYVRYKNEEKDQKFTQNERYINLPEKTQKIRFHFQFQPSEIITLKTRVETSVYDGQQAENGFLIFQDIQYKPAKIRFDFSTRVAWFNTESYNSRIYAYENDLLYTFSIPAYYGKGFRTYFYLKYQICDKLDLGFKIANTHWTDREIISSGYNEIQGKNKTELKLQLRLKI
ncbi:MAG: helix-hairpin-helix domain-containing protein [Draconibacterium sp.]